MRALAKRATEASELAICASGRHGGLPNVASKIARHRLNGAQVGSVLCIAPQRAAVALILIRATSTWPAGS
jgi:hypothetical protein